MAAPARPPGNKNASLLLSLGISVVIIIAAFVVVGVYRGRVTMLEAQHQQLEVEITSLLGDVDALKHEDQYVKNASLSAELANIRKTYAQAETMYESLVDLRALTTDTKRFDERFANGLALLVDRQWASASAQFTALGNDIAAAKLKVTSSFVIPANVPENNSAPQNGFSRQTVSVDDAKFLVDIVAGDLGSTKVIVDTASSGDCANDCPVKSLADYVSQNGAFAGINGSYFCPAEYPSCAGKTNSFDTLLMNKNKTYFNSANNVYSTVPAVIFLGGSVRFVGQSLEWGRDTSPDSLIANRPLLVSGGNIAFNGEGEPKEGNKGNRSFVANKGSVVYIGVVHNASVAESAKALHAMGMDNAINLDDGGSTALWASGGYKAGPGRNLPNAILFVRK
jgi:hypothetical protein